MFNTGSFYEPKKEKIEESISGHVPDVDHQL